MKNQTYLAVIHLKLLGYPLPNIRKALSKLTGITHADVARQAGRKRVVITQTIGTRLGNPKVQAEISNVYDVPVDELFEPRKKKA